MAPAIIAVTITAAWMNRRMLDIFIDLDILWCFVVIIRLGYIGWRRDGDTYWPLVIFYRGGYRRWYLAVVVASCGCSYALV